MAEIEAGLDLNTSLGKTCTERLHNGIIKENPKIGRAHV